MFNFLKFPFNLSNLAAMLYAKFIRSNLTDSFLYHSVNLFS